MTDWDRLHNKFHTARFACAVFSVAVLSEMSPFPVAASKTVLIEEAHVSDRLINCLSYINLTLNSSLSLRPYLSLLSID